MPTGNTSLLGLALPVQGELSGTWGDVVNQSITELVDSAVAGTTVLSADSDVTLTTTALAANQARQAILRWTASNGATTRNITAPAQSKPYIVINAGTGSIVLRGAGPTAGITIVAGERCLAAWSGSDFVKIATTASGAAAGSNTQVQFNSSGSLAGSANLTFDGSQLDIPLGSAAAPALSTPTDPNTGMFFPAADTIAFAEGGVEAMRLDASGNVGIGTSSPSAKLHIAGNTFRHNDATNSFGYTVSAATNTTTLATLFGGSSFAIQTGASGTNQLLLDSSGNLGLGVTPSPWVTLRGFQINTQASVSADGTSIQVSTNAYLGSGGWTYIGTGNATNYYQVNGTHAWRTAASGTAGNAISWTQAMTLDASGNLGIGTTSPAAKLDLAGDYKEGVVTANTGTAYTINTATGTVQILTLTGNCTFTFPTAVAGESFTLLLRQDGTGGRTVTWPANVRWPGGTAPTITSTASRQDKYIFTADGTNFYGSNAGQNYTV